MFEYIYVNIYRFIDSYCSYLSHHQAPRPRHCGGGGGARICQSWRAPSRQTAGATSASRAEDAAPPIELN